MSCRRTNVVGGGGASVTIAPWEHPLVWDFVGSGRYLQAAFCRSAAQLYSAKFGSTTLKSLSKIAAAGASSIGLVAWTKEIGCCWDESVFRSGAKGGSVEILIFLKNDCRMPRDSSLCRIAGAGGHLEALKFLRQTCGCVWDMNFCKAAATKGRLEILQYAHSQHSADRFALFDAPGWNSHTVCIIAARMGHIHILEWAYKILREDGLFDAETCKAAAAGGKLDVLRYLRSIRCAWDGSTCHAAISRGYVGVLKWAIDEGCPWTVNDRGLCNGTPLHNAANVEVIEFLISLGADINALDEDDQTPLYWSVDCGQLETVKTLVRLGADVNIADVDGGTPFLLRLTRTITK